MFFLLNVTSFVIQSLDTDCNGILDRRDFCCKDDRLLDAALLDIWNRIQIVFDFDGDSKITLVRVFLTPLILSVRVKQVN
jgi:hypothetical protein